MQLHLILLQKLVNLCYIAYHLSESGEIEVCSDTALLHSAFFKTTARGLGSFRAKENEVLPCCNAKLLR